MAALPATTMGELTPVILVVTASVAVIACEPDDFNVAAKVPTPFVIAALAGKFAALSVDVNARIPLYPVAVLPKAS